MSKNVRADESVLNSATTGGISLRTTIPSYIVAKLNLKKGDRLRWHIDYWDKEVVLVAQVIQEKSKPVTDDKL
jgi:Uri superfamily endonuclease